MILIENNKKQQIKDFLSQSISIDLIDGLTDYCLQDTWEDSEHLENYFTGYFDELTGEAFVYYYDAIEYLTENDPTLRNSVELAAGLGYDIKNIDSCTLANILHQNDRQKDELYKINFEELFNLINQ
jgi:hypothetical protein